MNLKFSNNEGLGIRSTARILQISTTTLLKRIVSIARDIVKPIISKRQDKTLSYVIDNLKLSETIKIFTDKLKNFNCLIKEKLHFVKRFDLIIIHRYVFSFQVN